MALKTASVSGAWSSTATWGGSAVPVDDDSVTINAAISVLMDVDQSGFANGIRTLTITGHATTPGMLYFANGTSGYLKMKTGYNIVGTNLATRGRILANSDGIWGNTGELAFANKAIIDLQGTAKIDALYLDLMRYCATPANLFVRTYKAKYNFTAGAGTVNIVNNTIDLGTTPPASDTAIMVTALAGGVLPAGITENIVYFCRGISGNTCKLSYISGSDVFVDITSTGSGPCTLFTGHTDTATATINVLDDVIGDAAWVTTSGHNRVVLVSAGPANYDQQRLTLVTIAAGSITLSENIDSVQYPGARIYLSARNISDRSYGINSSQPIIDYQNVTIRSGPANHLGCEIVNLGGSGTTFYGYGVNYGSGHTISGVVSGCSNGVNYGSGHTISGVVSGCSNGVNSGSGHTISGVISGCTYGLYCAGFTAFGMTLIGNATDIAYSGITGGQLIKGRSFKHAGIINDTRAWSAGGYMTHETTEKPVGKSFSHKFTYENIGYYNEMNWEIAGSACLFLAIPCYAKHDSTGLSATQRLHFQIINPASDPLINPANVALAEWVAADSTSWQSSILNYTRTDDTPLLLRICAQRASGSAYALIDNQPLGFPRKRQFTGF